MVINPVVLIFFDAWTPLQQQCCVDLNVNDSGCGRLMRCLQGWAPLPYMALHRLHNRIRLQAAGWLRMELELERPTTINCRLVQSSLNLQTPVTDFLIFWNERKNEWGRRGQRPFGIFPKIHPHVSLKQHQRIRHCWAVTGEAAKSSG